MNQTDFLKHGITIDEMVKAQDAIDKTHEDDTPFSVVTENGMHVVGDVNKTEIKKHDYTIRFRFPKEMANNVDQKDIISSDDNYVVVKMEYNDVHIKPRYDLDISAAIVTILPYFYSLNEETKKVGKRSQKEMIELVKGMCKEIGDDMYHLVAVVLGVDKSIEEYMVWDDVVDTFTRIPQDFPEVFNEAGVFSPGRS